MCDYEIAAYFHDIDGIIEKLGIDHDCAADDFVKFEHDVLDRIHFYREQKEDVVFNLDVVCNIYSGSPVMPDKIFTLCGVMHHVLDSDQVIKDDLIHIYSLSFNQLPYGLAT